MNDTLAQFPPRLLGQELLPWDYQLLAPEQQPEKMIMNIADVLGGKVDGVIGDIVVHDFDVCACEVIGRPLPRPFFCATHVSSTRIYRPAKLDRSWRSLRKVYLGGVVYFASLLASLSHVPIRVDRMGILVEDDALILSLYPQKTQLVVDGDVFRLPEYVETNRTPERRLFSNSVIRSALSRFM